MLCQLSYAPSAFRQGDCTEADPGIVGGMDENEQAQRQDESAEGGALDDEGEGGRRPGEPLEDPVESGGLERAAGTDDLLQRQAGKGYGEDEGQRDESLGRE